jgi:hypothetical protein
MEYEFDWLDLWGIKPWEHDLMTAGQFYRLCLYAQMVRDARAANLKEA